MDAIEEIVKLIIKTNNDLQKAPKHLRREIGAKAYKKLNKLLEKKNPERSINDVIKGIFESTVNEENEEDVQKHFIFDLLAQIILECARQQEE